MPLLSEPPRLTVHTPQAKTSFTARLATSLVTGLIAGLTALAGLRASAQSLPPEVDALLARAQVPPGALAALVVEAAPAPGAQAAPLLDWHAGSAMNPASVMKLVTTYAGLDLLGPAYTWATPVYADGPVPGGVLQGNLVIRGQGDPKLVMERLWLLLRRVQAAGITRIAGDIVLDRSAFAAPTQAPGDFDGEALRPYNVQPDALLVNYKSVTMTFTPQPGSGQARISFEPPLAGVQMQPSVPLSPASGGGATEGECGNYQGQLQPDFADPSRLSFAGSYPATCGEKTWAIAYADPASYGSRAIAGMWREMGGQLTGRVREGVAGAGLAPLFELQSPPLAEVIRDINKYSNNVMARQLFLTLSQQQPGGASTEASRAVLRDWWQSRIGGDAQDAPLLDNGAGLSRQARVTPRGLARMLQAAYASSVMPELMASLPINGVDGTLKRTLPTDSLGAAHLKTGSLRDSTALAGYVDAPGGRRLVIVAIINHPNAAAARPALDALVDWAARAGRR